MQDLVWYEIFTLNDNLSLDDETRARANGSAFLSI
jgi:hypothetical protein